MTQSPDKKPESKAPVAEKAAPGANKPDAQTKKKGKKDAEDYSPEDLKLKEDLAMHVQTITSLSAADLSAVELETQKTAILEISKLMIEATSSMTAIPKPLKFLREHIPALRAYYDSRTSPKVIVDTAMGGDDDIILPGVPAPTVTVPQWSNKKFLADLLSILAMVLPNEIGLVLKYRFDAIDGNVEGFDLEEVFRWGIGYTQNLSAEIAREYQRVLYAAHNDESDKQDSETSDDSTDGDDEYDELGQTALTKSQSQLAIIATAPKLTSSALSGHQSSSSVTGSTTMGDADDKNAKEASQTDTTKSTKAEETEQKSQRDAMGRKKELTDEEKAKIEAEELRVAKLPPTIHKPVTTATLDQLRSLSVRFLPHLFSHGCEIDAVDMLFETENIEAVDQFVDEDNSGDVLQYIAQSNIYNTDNPTAVNSLMIRIYLRLKQWSHALATALKLADDASRTRAIAFIFHLAREFPHVQLQLAHMLAQYTSNVSYLCSDSAQGHFAEQLAETDTVYTSPITDFPIITDYRAIEALQKGSCGSLSDKTLQELGVTRGKTRDDVCRADDEREDPYEWLAVGFANAGTKIINVLDANKAADGATGTKTQAANLILAKALSTGLIYVGDVDEGYSQVDPYLNPTIDEGSSTGKEQKDQSVLGGVVATALCGAGITNDFNAGIALLSDYCTDSDQYSEEIRVTAMQSLGIAAMGTRNEELRELFVPLLLDSDLSPMGRATAALSIGLVYLGSCDVTLTELIVAALIEMSQDAPAVRLTCVALALLVFKQRCVPDEITALWNTLEDPETGLNEAYTNFLGLVCNLCTHIGDGPTELIQELLRSLSTKPKNSEDDDDDDEDDEGEDGEEKEEGGAAGKSADNKTTTTTTTAAAKDDKSATTSTKGGKKVSLQVAAGAGKDKADEQAGKIEQQAYAETEAIQRALIVISMAFFSLSDVLTQQCTARVLSHLLECGSAEIRSAVPLAMAVLNMSHPSPALTDHLIRLTHDTHAPLAINAVLAIGLTAAGTNNSRSMAGISGFISETYDKTAIQIARIAQGLVVLGQGTLTLSTSIYNNTVLCERSVVGLLLVLTQIFEPQYGLCGKLPLWTILPVCARPRVLVTKVVEPTEPDGESEDVQIPVKMGQVQGGVLLGRKTVLSGIQVTHTPVVIGVGNYVQVDDDDYTALSHCLEGTVLVTKRTMG